MPSPPSCYDELVLILPSQRTHIDYKNAIRPVLGYNHEAISELQETTNSFSGTQ